MRISRERHHHHRPPVAVSRTSIPWWSVVKYYIPLKNKDFRPFIGAGLGPYFINRSLDFGVYSITEYTTQFGFYPELGFSYWVNSGFALSLNGKYNAST